MPVSPQGEQQWVRGQQLVVTSPGLVNFLHPFWDTEQGGVATCCVYPPGNSSQAEDFSGKCHRSSCSFCTGFYGVCSTVCVYIPQSQCYRALQKPPWVSVYVNSENPQGRMFSPSSSARSKCLAVKSGQAHPGASVWGSSVQLARSALESETRMDFQEPPCPLPSVLSGQSALRWFPIEDLIRYPMSQVDSICCGLGRKCLWSMSFLLSHAKLPNHLYPSHFTPE